MTSTIIMSVELKRRWLLVWFGESEIGPGFCSNNFRVIIIE